MGCHSFASILFFSPTPPLAQASGSVPRAAGHKLHALLVVVDLVVVMDGGVVVLVVVGVVVMEVVV